MSKSRSEAPEPISIPEDQPTKWFETLYSRSSKDGAGVPWANMTTHPSFMSWLRRNSLDGDGKSALVVGCGMGDDAVELEAHGFHVTAFDVSASAINYCKDRFPLSKVDFQQADLLRAQPQWRRRFDFVLEIFTIQALPPKYEKDLIGSIADFVAPRGQLVVIAETSKQPRIFENGPPWLLTPAHIDSFASNGLMVEERFREKSDFEGAENLLTSTFRRTGS